MRLCENIQSFFPLDWHVEQAIFGMAAQSVWSFCWLWLFLCLSTLFFTFKKKKSTLFFSLFFLLCFYFYLSHHSPFIAWKIHFWHKCKSHLDRILFWDFCIEFRKKFNGLWEEIWNLKMIFKIWVLFRLLLDVFLTNLISKWNSKRVFWVFYFSSHLTPGF